MKYKVGDKVLIKSLDWYNKNKTKHGDIWFDDVVFTGGQSLYCGCELTIRLVTNDRYYVNENDYYWTDDMIECKVEEEIKPKFKVGDKITNGHATLTILTLSSDRYVVEDTFGECGTLYFNFVDDWKIVEEEVGLVDTFSSRWVNEFNLPDGYIFKDENGNIINAQKIILEKKSSKYPKTYEECSTINGAEGRISLSIIGKFTRLINARNAYWRVAGQEMGLGKPWKPDWANQESPKYCIASCEGRVKTAERYIVNTILAFPTAEMRDAFYEVFREEIEICKELL